MNESQIDAWKADAVRHAKEILLKEGYLPSIAFFITQQMEIDESFKKVCMAIDTGAKKDIKPNDLVVAMMQIDESWESLFGMIQFSSGSQETSDLLDATRTFGMLSGNMNPEKRIVEQFMKEYDLGSKDIIAMAMAEMVRRVSPIAVCKIDEMWYQQADKADLDAVQARLEEGDSLENNPDSKEAIGMLFETKDSIVLTTIPFTRESGRGSKVTGFLETIVIIDDGKEYSSLEGRFCNFLMPRKDGKPSVVTFFKEIRAKAKKRNETNPNLN